MEQQQQAEADIAREKLDEMETALGDEKRKKEACEHEIQQHLQVRKWTEPEKVRPDSQFSGSYFASDSVAITTATTGWGWVLQLKYLRLSFIFSSQNIGFANNKER